MKTGYKVALGIAAVAGVMAIGAQTPANAAERNFNRGHDNQPVKFITVAPKHDDRGRYADYQFQKFGRDIKYVVNRADRCR